MGRRVVHETWPWLPRGLTQHRLAILLQVEFCKGAGVRETAAHSWLASRWLIRLTSSATLLQGRDHEWPGGTSWELLPEGVELLAQLRSHPEALQRAMDYDGGYIAWLSARGKERAFFRWWKASGKYMQSGLREVSDFYGQKTKKARPSSSS